MKIIDLTEDIFDPSDDLYWFWYNPKTKEIFHVDSTHTSCALYDMGLYTEDEMSSQPDLEDVDIILKAISAGWVRGRYGHMDKSNNTGWDFSENETAELSLQGRPREVWMAAKQIMNSKSVHTLYVDFGSGTQMESHMLYGKRLEYYVKTGKIPSSMIQ